MEKGVQSRKVWGQLLSQTSPPADPSGGAGTVPVDRAGRSADPFPKDTLAHVLTTALSLGALVT